MTVKELIEMLSDLEPSAKVLIFDPYTNEYRTVTGAGFDDNGDTPTSEVVLEADGDQ